MAENSTTDSGRIVKMEVDYSLTCDEKIPECQKLAKEGKIHDALDTLLALEKQTRTVSCLYDVYLEYVTREFAHIMHKHCVL
jgi:26S proteasome regulatory subunit N5